VRDYENLYFTIDGSIQYKQYNNRIREEKNNLYKKRNYVKQKHVKCDKFPTG